MSRSEQETLADALLHLTRLDHYATLDLDQDVVVDAIAMRLAAMIDSLSALPPDVLANLFGGTWPAMRGMRNRIAHGYHTVNPDVLRITVSAELPHIRKTIEHRLHSHE